jgi:hypothetical protein
MTTPQTPQTGVAPAPIPGGHTTAETPEEPRRPAPVGLCQHCDQPVYPGTEEIVGVITGGAGQAADVLLHKGGCRRRSEEPRRHN